MMSDVALLDEYQKAARKTAIFTEEHIPGLAYCALKLNGEAGEVAEEVGKMYRDDNGVLWNERRERLLYELGDVLWYVANLANLLKFPLSQVAQANLDKLERRKNLGVLPGRGSDR
jgi:NTP pyrophosphatase (non-canonical NTP hydrolase)